jgi:DNA helicase-2/ATP-dependent DNA helicase PcrA
LWTDNGYGSHVSLNGLWSIEEEALFIASEIVRLINLSKGLLQFSNFAVLFRTTMLSRVLEQTFTVHYIPYTMVGELRYFETAEIKDLLAYLNLLQNPHNNGEHSDVKDG